ncbi:MAG: hypothetical protein WCS73_11950 [Lentisphaeria bacterium]
MLRITFEHAMDKFRIDVYFIVQISPFRTSTDFNDQLHTTPIALVKEKLQQIINCIIPINLGSYTI